MKLYDEFKGMRSHFEILAVHNPHPNAKTIADLEKTMDEKGLIKKWGQDLPFPIILDDTGKTVKAYSVSAYPTTLLIDPEGNLVRGGSEKMLHEKLEELRKAKTTGTQDDEQ